MTPPDARRETNDISSRFSPQERFPELGEAGQKRLLAASILVVGCGGLGTHALMWLARAGVGRLRFTDPDRACWSNLHRQVLLDESDAVAGRPKAEACLEKLKSAASGTVYEPRHERAHAGNLGELTASMDLVMDATDNLETRFAINDTCLREGIPWVYGGAVGSTGMVLPVLPGKGPCLSCLFPELSPSNRVPSSDTHGILNVTAGAVAALQVGQAFRILTGGEFAPALSVIDTWTGELRRVSVRRAKNCPACGHL